MFLWGGMFFGVEGLARCGLYDMEVNKSLHNFHYALFTHLPQYKQQFLPDELKDRRLWEAQDNAAEQKHAERMRALWGEDKFRKS